VEWQLALVRRVLGADDEGGNAKVRDLDLACFLVPDDVVWLRICDNVRLVTVLFSFIYYYFIC